MLIGSALGYMPVPHHSGECLHTEGFGTTTVPADWLMQATLGAAYAQAQPHNGGANGLVAF